MTALYLSEKLDYNLIWQMNSYKLLKSIFSNYSAESPRIIHKKVGLFPRINRNKPTFIKYNHLIQTDDPANASAIFPFDHNGVNT